MSYIDKVKPSTTYLDSKYTFLEVPKEIREKSMVEVLTVENQRKDEYMVVANDMTVIDTPMPWNHKQIDYHKIDCIPVPHQFY